MCSYHCPLSPQMRDTAATLAPWRFPIGFLFGVQLLDRVCWLLRLGQCPHGLLALCLEVRLAHSSSSSQHSSVVTVRFSFPLQLVRRQLTFGTCTSCLSSSAFCSRIACSESPAASLCSAS